MPLRFTIVTTFHLFAAVGLVSADDHMLFTIPSGKSIIDTCHECPSSESLFPKSKKAKTHHPSPFGIIKIFITPPI
ncbi:hypothetical protein B0H16DRAFT_340326 [Mycena metata]|uniref:Secreted protein n=1 Tax=Mycena metata TaxID=1033252 RepID=A0AAD7MMU2_9AGAR|nr:hypothetical protein B0H16DRAFT_340326 [Mycena metata]